MIEQKVSEEQVRSLLVKGILYGCFSEGRFLIFDNNKKNNYRNNDNKIDYLEKLVQRMANNDLSWFEAESKRHDSDSIEDLEWLDENSPLEVGTRKERLLNYLHVCSLISDKLAP